MKMKTTGLGKGLNAIFEIEDNTNAQNSVANGITEIEISRIKANPAQPRTHFQQEALDELSQSIARLGVIQPITIKRGEGDEFMIISGERRFRASQIAGLKSIPAYIRQAEDTEVLEMALVENIQREDLNAMEIAITMQRLLEECSLTQEVLSERVGKKRSTVANYIRLLKLPAELQVAIRKDIISMGHARALISIESTEKQLEILEKIITNGLSVRQVEEMVAQIGTPRQKAKAQQKALDLPDCYTNLMHELSRIVGKNISIKQGQKGDGKIIIKFSSQEEVDNIIKNLTKLS